MAQFHPLREILDTLSYVAVYMNTPLNLITAKCASGETMKKANEYNNLLFSGRFRSRLHYARFLWFKAEIAKRNCLINSILELGCFDGKLLTFLPNKPSRYVGYDANWGGGLDLAIVEWAGEPNFFFHQATSPEEMRLDKNDTFNIAVAMETLEHVPPQMVDEYLSKVAQHLDGYFFVSVPNEKGIFFLAKWIIKKIFTKDAQHYSFTELTNATLGRMEKVTRLEHKGFDYDSLIKQIARYFDVIEVTGLPLGFLPRSLCFTIGIVAKSKVNAKPK
jgi:2-polyprenyl-3-methyl-5-hydroxy-6-metoxy-1,4-benzoquinol methylase